MALSPTFTHKLIPTGTSCIPLSRRQSDTLSRKSETFSTKSKAFSRDGESFSQVVECYPTRLQTPDFQPQGPGRFLECLAGLYLLTKAKNTSRTTVPVTLSTIIAQMWQHCSHVFRSSRAKDTHPRVTHSTLGTRVWSNSKAIRSAILALKILDKIRGTFGPGPLVRPIASTPARHTQGHRGQPGRTGCCRRCGAEPAGTGRYRRPFHCPPCWAHVPHDALGN